MRKSLIITLIGILTMGLFSFLKKEKKTNSQTNSTILGMVLLEDPNSFDLNGTVNELKTKWKLDVKGPSTDGSATVLVIQDYHVAIAPIPAAIPGGEVERAVEFNYFWDNGIDETSRHNGHIILSIMNAGKNAVQENLIFSEVASSVMNNCKSLGIYIGSRTLVLKKDFYQANMEVISDQQLPIHNWIYFGLRNENSKHSVYTYGLADFGKMEMEIVDSDKSLEELNGLMTNLAHYVIAYNVVLKNGETIGMSAEQKLKITESQGRYVEGNTLKIDY